MLWLLLACGGTDSDTDRGGSPCTLEGWADEDGDGFGDPAHPFLTCALGDLADNDRDCDDADAAVYPDAPETCDGVDEDCSGAADEAWDADGDGVAPCAGDCDDADPARAAGIPERCDGVDDDCDGAVDEGFDADGDGWSTCHGDCADDDPATNPSSPEVCDGVDNDCDPSTSEDGDLDGDGVTRCGGDCDDTNALACPGQPEACDGADNDCSGAIDDLPECFACEPAGRYTYCQGAATWPIAEGMCEALGGTLVIMDDGAENDAVSVETYNRTGNASWIGLTDAASEGTWLTAVDAPPSFTAWWTYEPNDSGGEDCAGTNFGAVARWNDFACGTQLPFVCETP
jgi:hypothetical protein